MAFASVANAVLPSATATEWPESEPIKFYEMTVDECRMVIDLKSIHHSKVRIHKKMWVQLIGIGRNGNREPILVVATDETLELRLRLDKPMPVLVNGSPCDVFNYSEI